MSQRPQDAPVYDLDECRLAVVDDRRFEFRRVLPTDDAETMVAHWPSEQQVAALTTKTGENQIVIAANEGRDSLVTKFGAIPNVTIVGIDATHVQYYHRTEFETSWADYSGAAIQDEAAMLEIAIRHWTGEHRSRQWAVNLCDVSITWRDVLTNEIIPTEVNYTRPDWQPKLLFPSITW